MDAIGLITRVIDAAEEIAEGRKGLEIEGSAEAGRVSYQNGLAKAMAVFQETAKSGDARTLILIDHAYVTQERQFCDPQDADAISSLKAATTSFDDALRVLQTVASTALYQAVETSYPHDSNYRVSGMPKDAYHVACIAHKTRLRNSLRTPGLSMTEKVLYKQRQVNMGTAQGVYLVLQKRVLQ